MEAVVYNIKGEDTGRKVVLNDKVFGLDLNEGNAKHTVYLSVKQYLGNQRQGTHKSKERSEVSGSTRKLGRRRAAAVRVAATSTLRCCARRRHGVRSASPRLPCSKLNKKMKALARKDRPHFQGCGRPIFVVENFTFDAPKTKSYMAIAKAFNLDEKKVLLVMNGATVRASFRCAQCAQRPYDAGYRPQYLRSAQQRCDSR